MAIRIGRWDCNTCGHNGNMGNVLNCEQCNIPRDKNVEFYLPDDAEIVTDAKIIKAANAGADWNCSHCGAANKATSDSCHSCGNAKDSDDKSLEEKEYDLTNTPKTSEDVSKKRRKPQNGNENIANYSQNITNNPKNTNRNIFIGVGTFLFTAVMTLVLFIYIPQYSEKTPWTAILNFSTHDYLPAVAFHQQLNEQYENITYTVGDFYWQRNIDIEKGVDVAHEDWEIPAGGRKTNSFSAIHHYDEVQDGTTTKYRSKRVASGTRRYKCGTTSKGNGHFADKYCTETTYTTKSESYQVPHYKSVPVYRTKYQYLMREWHFDHTETSEGADIKPFWKNYDKTYKNEFWREATKRELYKVKFQTQDINSMQINQEMTFENWKEFANVKQVLTKQHIAAFRPTLEHLLAGERK